MTTATGLNSEAAETFHDRLRGDVLLPADLVLASEGDDLDLTRTDGGEMTFDSAVNSRRIGGSSDRLGRLAEQSQLSSRPMVGSDRRGWG